MIINGIADRECRFPGLINTKTLGFPCRKADEDHGKKWADSKYECSQYTDGVSGNCATSGCWSCYSFDNKN